MGRKFMKWFSWFLDGFCDFWESLPDTVSECIVVVGEFVDAAWKKVYPVCLIILLFPIWIIPFLCCYLTSWQDWSDIDG